MSSTNDMKKKIFFKDLRRATDPSVQYHWDITVCTLNDVKAKIFEKIKTEDYILCMPNRALVTNDNYEDLRSGDTVLILRSLEQTLPQEVKYSVNIAPHPDTITKSGMYEYYSSRGIDSVVISIAELIDNSLAATKDNDGLRQIEIRFYEDGKDSIMFIIDNGHGMDYFQLTNWAKFKYSKFVRDYRFDETHETPNSLSSTPLTQDSGFMSFSSVDLPLNRTNRCSTPLPNGSPKAYCPRYLDSEINYFGAGGKQAIFNIGAKTKMTTKRRGNKDVLELTLSKQEFDIRSQTNPDQVYKQDIISHTAKVERQLPEDAPISTRIEYEITESLEHELESFTCCSIQNIESNHITYLKKGSDSLTDWAKNLARIYHYYLHGPKGNTEQYNELAPELSNLQILIKMYNVIKSGGILKFELKDTTDLREIDTDYETLLVRRAKSIFEFDIDRPNQSPIEGIIRYHPYVHDRETLPRLNDFEDDLCETNSINSHRTNANEFSSEDNEEFRRSQPLKSREKPVFECYWHGRLIPNTNIDFEWNKYNQKSSKMVPEECYNRLSGALFTNHSYKVTQNKLTFIDLYQSIFQSPSPDFFKVVTDNGVRRRVRGDVKTEFVKWIGECHTKFDKQVKYSKFQGCIARSSYPNLRKLSLRTDTLSVFDEIEWRNKKWKKGDKIQTKDTRPSNLIGAIVRFLVPIKLSQDTKNYDGSPGLFEISQLPEEIYGSDNDATKICNFSQINLEVSKQQIEKELINHLEKLPEKILITFPKEHPLSDGEVIPAGRPIGDIQAFIQNSKGENLKDRIPYKSGHKKMSLQMEILLKEGRSQTSVAHAYEMCYWSKQWDYWFLPKEDGIKKAGSYCLTAAALITSDNKTEALFHLPNGKALPSAKQINFTVIAGPPKRFIICDERIEALIGKSFDLSLKFFDEYDNEAKPVLQTDIFPVFTLNGFEVKSDGLKVVENRCLVRNVNVLGEVTNLGKVHKLRVELPELLSAEAQEVSITLKFGNPYKIVVYPEEQLEFINGTVPQFEALVYDRGGNNITFHNHLSVFCKFMEINESGQKSDISSEYKMVQEFRDQLKLVFKNVVVIKAPNESSRNSRAIIARFWIKALNPTIYLELPITLKKSCKPSVIKLFYAQNIDGQQNLTEIINETPLEFTAGSTLSNIFLKAYDCDGTEIVLPDLDISVLTISWADGSNTVTRNGELPPISMPTSTEEIRNCFVLWKELQKNIDLRHDFKLKAIPDSPVRMYLKVPEEPIVFKLGETFKDIIHINIVDKYNNKFIRSIDLLKRLCIQPISNSLRIDDFEVKNGFGRNGAGFIISGIKLVPKHDMNFEDLGKNKLLFKIEGNANVSALLDILVVNGVPKYLKWFNDSKFNGIIVCTNNHRLQIQTQLLDEYNNPIRESGLSAKLRLGKDFLNPELSADIDPKGIATFSDIIRIKSKEKIPSNCSVPQEIPRALQSCQTLCYGFTKILAQVHYENQVIKTSHYWLHVLCDNKTPAKFSITHSGNLNVKTHSSDMPTIQVTVCAEDNTILRNLEIEKIFMHLINKDENGQEFDIEFAPKMSSHGIFYFKPDLAPFPNKYKVKIVYNQSQPIEEFYKNIINVIPGPPSKMLLSSGSLSVPIIVSNTENKRSLINSPLLLDIADSNGVPIYKNISSQELETNPIYSGRLRARICSSNNRNNAPELEGSDTKKCLEFPIKGGRVRIQELRLKNNSQANDGEYSLIFDAYLNSSETIESYVSNILYSNDALKQTQLNDIQMKLNDFRRKRTEISKEIINLDADFESQEQNYKSCQNKVELLKVQLRELTKGEATDLSTEQNVITKIEEYNQRKNVLQANQSSRVIRGNTSLNTPKKDGIIGRIGQLAFIEDNETALIISWFLRNFMTCIVTNTSEVAEKLMDERSDEMDLTFPLDQIRDKDLPKHWNDSLPHEDKFDFCYAIGYARSRLEFHSISNIEASHKVFGSLLKNTLIMDTIEAAKSYRKKFEKFDGLPTILTKSGFILHENGIIESAHLENIAVAFQSPPNIELLNVLKIIDLLKELKKAIRISEDERLSLQNCSKNHQNFKNNKNRELEEIDLNISLNEMNFRRLSVSGLENQSSLLSESNQNSFDINNNTYRRSQSRPECESEPSSKRARISR